MNKVMLIGNLTADPVARDAGGVRNCRFTVAVQRRYTAPGKDPVTDFISVVTWRGLAETCEKYLAKGRKVGVVGSIQTSTTTAEDGSKRYFTDVVADEVEFLTPKSQSQGMDDGYSAHAPRREKASIEKLQPMEDDSLPF